MELLWQIGLNMNLDAATLDTVDGFKEFLFLTQVWQVPLDMLTPFLNRLIDH